MKGKVSKYVVLKLLTTWILLRSSQETISEQIFDENRAEAETLMHRQISKGRGAVFKLNKE